MPYANQPPNTPFGPDWQLRALIARQQYANGVTADCARLLSQFYVELRDRLQSGVDFAPSERAQLTALTNWARSRLNEVAPGIVSTVYESLAKAGPVEQLAQVEQANLLRVALGTPSRGQLVAVARFDTVIRNVDIGGLPLQDWWQTNAVRALSRMKRTIQSDMLQGAGPMEVARRALRGVDGANALGDLQLHEVRMAVRTAMTAVSSEASRIEQREMSDVIERVEFVSINDARRSEICLHNDGKKYILGAANIPYPPLHIGCRSSIEPVVDLSAFGLPASKLGKRVSADEWLRAQDNETQNQVLGRAKANYYRQGKLQIGAIINADHEVMTLKQFEERVKAA